MPTATGRETTSERETRKRAERYEAMRAAITDDMRAVAAIDAAAILAGGDPPEYGAGEPVLVQAGRQRPEPIDAGELQRLALADAVEAVGLVVGSHRTSFGLFAGPASVFYSLRVRR